MSLDVNALKEHLCHVMCAEVKLVERGGRIVLRTPFSFPDGDPYILYLEEISSGAVRLTDAGHTLMHLSYENEIDKFRQGTRGKLFDQILADSGLSISDGALKIDTSPDQVGVSIFRIGQAINSIYDLTFLNRNRTESTFYEDLAESLFRLVDKDKIQRDFTYGDMENAQDYPVDYRIEGKADPLFVFGIPGRDKARLATIILERLLRVNASFESVLIFADQGSIPRQDLARLSNVGGEMISSLDAQEDMRRKLVRRVAA